MHLAGFDLRDVLKGTGGTGHRIRALEPARVVAEIDRRLDHPRMFPRAEALCGRLRSWRGDLPGRLDEERAVELRLAIGMVEPLPAEGRPKPIGFLAVRQQPTVGIPLREASHHPGCW
jgi:hypothetical protein